MTMSPIVVLPGQGRVLDMGPFSMQVLADGDATGSSLLALEASEPPGFGPPLHVHDDAAEAFYVLEGEYRMLVAGTEHLCPTGSFLFVPAGTEHTFVVGARQSRKLNLYLPSAMLGYFEALAQAQVTGVEPDLSALAAAHAMRVTGPVPEGYV
jgi:quercetin dioxygenase-like cupin family protein